MFSGKLFLQTAVLVLVGSAGSGAAHAATLANGGFETGDLSGWTLTNASPYDAVCLNGALIGSSTCDANSGSYAMSFGQAGALTTLSQALTTVPGVVYVLSFFLANDNPAGDPEESFAMSWNGNTVFSLASPQASFAYSQRVFGNLVATSTTSTVSFDARNDPAQWFLDEVSIAEAPEPATLVLTGIGLAAFALLRRRS